ncbi:MAG: hypothetical protein QOE45_2740 [Frankiaceae bacterium]|jgi:hypothetical protein|nr:hypothetical protein [Frankiaceae bacterium]
MRTRGTATVLGGLAVAAALQAYAAPPAAACSCATRGETDLLASADAVFVGRIASERAAGREVVWTFAVDAVVKGRVAARQTVRSSAFGSSCGAELLNHTRYLVFADVRDDGTVETGLCSGNRRVADDYAPTNEPTAQPQRPSGRNGVPWPFVLVAAAAGAAATFAVRRRQAPKIDDSS